MFFLNKFRILSNIILVFITCFIFAKYILIEIKADEPKEYEYWGDDYFENIDSLRDNLDVIKFSYGFFPKPYLFWDIGILEKSKGWNYNSGEIDLREQFPDFNYIFSSQPDISNRDLEDQITEKKYFSDKNKYGFFTSPEDLFVLGISFSYTLQDLHTILALNTGYSYRDINLYAPTHTSYYLDHQENKKQLKENIIFTIQDKSFFSNINLIHPVYGVSVGSYDKKSSYSLFYYLTYGIGCDFTFSDKLSAYRYISSETNNIRFDNGEIKETIFSNQNINKISDIRYNCNVGIGYFFSVGKLHNRIELNYCFGLEPLLKNSSIKQNILNLHIYLNAPVLYEILLTLGSILY